MANNWELVGAPISETSPATASTVASTATISGLSRYDWFKVVATLQGATGGTLDVYIQGLLAATYYDWGHYTQIAAGGAATIQVVEPQPNNGAVTIGSGLTPALAANTFIGGYPADRVRLVYVAGAGTSAGAAQVVSVYGMRR